MIRLNNLAAIIVLFIVISFLLSTFKVIDFTLTDILSYSLLIIGIALVYGESIRQNRLSVFLGAVIFLLGVYFLIAENFELTNKDGMSVPIILIFAGTGLLVLHISTRTKKIFMIISILLLSAGLTFLLMNSHSSIGLFFHSLVPVLNFFWPAIIVLAILVVLLRKK